MWSGVSFKSESLKYCTPGSEFDNLIYRTHVANYVRDVTIVVLSVVRVINLLWLRSYLRLSQQITQAFLQETTLLEFAANSSFRILSGPTLQRYWGPSCHYWRWWESCLQFRQYGLLLYRRSHSPDWSYSLALFPTGYIKSFVTCGGCAFPFCIRLHFYIKSQS